MALELQKKKKTLLSSERNIGFGYSTERKGDTFKGWKLHVN